MAAPEVPDWTRPVSVMGKDSEGNPVTVLLDSLGRLICVLYGAITLSGPVDVTQVDSTREIQGADGVTLHTIAVDSEGRIIALIKGVYSGELKNVAVDEQGRMIMIPTDPADIWGNAISMGNAELASRLKGMGGYDRRGQWIWGTNFEDGLQGSSPAVDHADSVFFLSTGRAFSGAYSLKLDPRGAADAYVEWSRVIHFLPAGKIGFETIISLDTDPINVRWVMRYYDGTNVVRNSIYYYPATGNWLILKSDGNYATVLTGVILQQGAAAWHHVKIVIDVKTEKYTYLLIDKTEVDLSAYDLRKGADASLGQLSVNLACFGSVAANAAIFVGGVIVTQGEPANV